MLCVFENFVLSPLGIPSGTNIVGMIPSFCEKKGAQAPFDSICQLLYVVLGTIKLLPKAKLISLSFSAVSDNPKRFAVFHEDIKAVVNTLTDVRIFV